MKKQWKSVLGGLSALLLLSCSVASFGQELRGLKVNDQIDTVKKAIQSKNAKWVAGETSLSKLSPEDQQARVGYNFELLNVPPLPKSKLVTRGKLPTSVDWRKKGVVARIKDQGQCGSCWAFALTGAMESYVMRAPSVSKKVELSEQVMLSCSGAGSCNGGRLNANFLKTTGLPPTDFYPYQAADGSCDDVKDGWKNAAYKIDSWGSISANLEDIKSALAQYGPLPTALWVYEDLMHYQSGVYSYTTGKKLGGHAVILVGYNDDGNYFIVKNSWGSAWGEDGYFKVAYSELDSAISFGMMSIAYTSNPDDNDFPVGTLKLDAMDLDQVVEDSPLMHSARRTMLAQ